MECILCNCSVRHYKIINILQSQYNLVFMCYNLYTYSFVFFQNGYIVCDPVICLADSELPCERPIRKQGACCKTCDNTQGITYEYILLIIYLCRYICIFLEIYT